MSNTLPAVQAPDMAQTSPAPSDETHTRRRNGRFAARDTTLVAAMFTGLVAIMIFGYARIDDDIDMREDRINARFDKVDTRFAALEEDIDTRFADLEEDIDARFAALEGDIDARFERVDARFDDMDARLGRLETQIAVLSVFLGVPGAEDWISDTAPTGSLS